MPPLPISRAQADNLGKRLCVEPVSQEDWQLLFQVLDTYQAALDEVQEILEQRGYEPTSRVKSTATLVDKLRRGTSFKSVSDVAGARIVLDGGRTRQDAVAADIVDAFTVEGERPPKLIDRRKQPTHGYRAVHVVIHRTGMPIEVQLRTTLQDVWAQITERLGDSWGRELRYGLPVRDGDEKLPGTSLTRNSLVEQLEILSEWIDALEEWDVANRGLIALGEPVDPEGRHHSTDRLLDALEAIGSIVSHMEAAG